MILVLFYAVWVYLVYTPYPRTYRNVLINGMLREGKKTCLLLFKLCTHMCVCVCVCVRTVAGSRLLRRRATKHRTDRPEIASRRIINKRIDKRRIKREMPTEIIIPARRRRRTRHARIARCFKPRHPCTYATRLARCSHARRKCCEDKTKKIASTVRDRIGFSVKRAAAVARYTCSAYNNNNNNNVYIVAWRAHVSRVQEEKKK